MDFLTFDGMTWAEFAFDAQRRTMTGLVMPYGQIGRHRDGRKWRFTRGSLKFADAKYVRLNDEHVQSARIGRGVSAQETDAGLVMTFSIYDGELGDRALAEAADGSKTGFSPEVEFDLIDAQRDPENPGVLLVNMANLERVGFVRMPAFTDARLISMRANHDGGFMTTCEHCGQQLTPGVAHTCTPPATPTATPPANPPATPPADPPATPPADPTPVQFSADQFAQMMAQFGTPGGRPLVDPTATGRPAGVTPPAQVTEPLPYRFSYQGGGRHVFAPDADHDFSTDLMTVLKASSERRDPGDALTRVNALISETFAVGAAVTDQRARATFANVGVADSTDFTNPHRYRPDMWQAQLDFPTPLWDMINAGTTDATKFDIPKFSSSSGLVSAATEKTEPAAGAYVAQLQTITPTQVWGKVEITRQAYRIGGSPQLSGILWDQMLREYYEDREAAAATFLNTLTAATDITLTGSPATPTNDDDQATLTTLETALADLQFARGGNVFRAFAVHQALYRVLARVKDDAGRPLYPQIAPQNANGTTARGYKTIDIGGTTAIGAYALGTVSTTPTNSWLFDPAKVLGWASAPERLFWDFGATVQTANLPQLSFVTMGIYGDVALGNTDIAGVRQVIFDPNTAA